ncbi:MAG: hypothetical protein KDC57_00070 [Saprospiraceae bacterium]|nr:hypothetical protein [Saprospiraceae bacterium]
MRLLFFILLAASTYYLPGQSGIVFQNSSRVNPNRYDDIQGSPMMFKDWMPGRIIGKGGEIFPDLFLNFNGYTQGFEAKQGDQYIELDNSQCVLVEVFVGEDTMRFAAEMLSPVRGNWVEQIFVGNGVYCIKHFNVDVSTQVVQNVGNEVKFKRFNPKSHYFFLEGGDLEEFRPRRKSVLKLLGGSKETAQYLDVNEIDVESDSGLRRVLQYYAGLKN